MHRLGLVAGLLLAMACDAPRPEPDGGPVVRVDGGAGMDASVPPRDAGPASRCRGTPTACALLDGMRCGTVEGCVLTRCGGFPVACDRRRSQETCEASEGCAWTGASCSGTARACATIAGEAECAAQAGCIWRSTTELCGGEPVACEGRSDATCEDQPGCTLPRDAGPPRDGGPLPPPDAWVPVCETDAGVASCVAPEGPPPFAGCNPTEGVECDGDWTGINPSTGAAYCDPACAETECCAPRDGRFQCTPRGADGSCPGADIFVDASHIEGAYTIDERLFEEGDCAIAEGCVNGPGVRRLLRFDTWTPNIGGADLYLGDVPASGVSTDIYEWSDCHGHHHFRSYAEYELLSEDACCVAVTGRKQAFCLIDLGRYDTSMGSDTAAYNCGFQGIQRGWQDIYGSGLDCQWIDITDVPPGNYVLRIRLNTEHVLLESSYDNNEASVRVTIP